MYVTGTWFSTKDSPISQLVQQAKGTYFGPISQLVQQAKGTYFNRGTLGSSVTECLNWMGGGAYSYPPLTFFEKRHTMGIQSGRRIVFVGLVPTFNLLPMMYYIHVQ